MGKDQNRLHIPIFFLLEVDPPTQVYSVYAWNWFDQTLNSIFPPERHGCFCRSLLPGRVISPDFVRGNRSSITEAIEKDGWPSLSECLGKAIFLLKPMIQTTYPVWMVNFLFLNVSETVGKIAFPVFDLNTHWKTLQW